MKKYVRKAVLIFGYLLLIGIVTGLGLAELFDIKELFLVMAGSILLTLPHMLEKKGEDRLLEIAGNNGMISSYMVAFVLILGKAGQMEPGEAALREILLSLRPILYGFSMLVLLKQPEEGNRQRGIGEAVMKVSADESAVAWEEEKGTETPEDRCRRLGLTGRESEIVKLVLRGLSNREIGERLYIAENTVKKHMSNIFEKLEVENREQLKQLFRQP